MVAGKRFFRLAVLLVLSTGLLFVGCSGGGGGGGEYYAVLVGVAQYNLSYINLSYTDKDAVDFRSVIVTGENWDPGRVTLLLNGAATKAAIRDAIFNTAARMGPDDYFVFYFSGHGTPGPDFAPVDEYDGMDEFLVVHDALETSYANDIRDDELDNWLQAVPSNNILAVFDTCFSGGMFKTAGGVKSISRPWHEENRTAGRPDGIIKDLNRSGYVVLTSSDDHEQSVESYALANGVFTHFLVQGLYGPANVDGNGFISAAEAYTYSAPRSTAFYGLQHAQMFDAFGGQYKLILH